MQLPGTPARLARLARERVLKISPDWPWNTRPSPAGSGSAPSQHLPDQREPPRQHGRRHGPARSEPVRPGHTGRRHTTGPGKQTDSTPETGHPHNRQPDRRNDERLRVDAAGKSVLAVMYALRVRELIHELTIIHSSSFVTPIGPLRPDLTPLVTDTSTAAAPVCTP